MRWLFVITLAAGFVPQALGQTPASKIAPQKGWHTSLEAARAEARKANKPIMLVFRCDP